MIPPDPLYPFSFGEAGNGEGVQTVWIFYNLMWVF